MRLITKPKLPKWLISTLPFREEEEMLSGLIVPFILFSLMGVGTMWYEFYESLLPFLGVVITILIFVLSFTIMWWLVVQIDVLRILRLRLVTHYKLIEDEEERLKIKERLSDLCVKV